MIAPRACQTTESEDAGETTFKWAPQDLAGMNVAAAAVASRSPKLVCLSLAYRLPHCHYCTAGRTSEVVSPYFLLLSTSTVPSVLSVPLLSSSAVRLAGSEMTQRLADFRGCYADVYTSCDLCAIVFYKKYPTSPLRTSCGRASPTMISIHSNASSSTAHIPAAPSYKLHGWSGFANRAES